MTTEAIKNETDRDEALRSEVAGTVAGNETAGNDTGSPQVTSSQVTRKRILICDTQPVAVEGMKWLIENSGDLHVAAAVSTLEAVTELLNPGAARIAAELAALSARSAEADAAGLELSDLIQLPEAGAQESGVSVAEASAEDILACLRMGARAESAGEQGSSEGIFAVVETGETVSVGEMDYGPLSFDAAYNDAGDGEAAATGTATAEPEPEPLPDPLLVEAIVLDKGLGIVNIMEFIQKLAMGSHAVPAVVWGAINEAEALRLLQAGARGILRRTSESGTLLTCLRAVTAGGTWMEDGIFGSTDKLFNPRRSQLTHRESEVVELVEKGLRNRDIARILGIQTGTVKIHLKHIFEKTGVRGRYGLAFTGLQNKGSINLPTPTLNA